MTTVYALEGVSFLNQMYDHSRVDQLTHIAAMYSVELYTSIIITSLANR